jgi:alkylated DNA nucleotide flippase Atl1
MWSEPDEYAEAVLDAVEHIPPGRVLSYGDVAELVGRGGPRQVGRVMSLYGGAVPWWRVIRADGRPPQCHEGQAHEHYRAEGTPLRPDGLRVDMSRARGSGPATP